MTQRVSGYSLITGKECGVVHVCVTLTESYS